MRISTFTFFRHSITYLVFKKIKAMIVDFIETIGELGHYLAKVAVLIFKLQINIKQTIAECSRFAVDSLPITLTIVGMVSIILSMQIAPEMVKQGGGAYVGMLVVAVMIREMAAIMAGFAIISMIGSSMASEIATMKVTEQIDAIRVLHVDPLKYLFVPKILSGIIMMPFVVIIACYFGILCAALTSKLTADVSWLNFVSSAWFGIQVKDILVCLLKSSVFGGAIALISSVSGYSAVGGAKLDYLFALVFYV